MKQKYIIAAVIALVIIVGGAYYLFTAAPKAADNTTESAQDEKSVDQLEVGETIQQNGYTIERLPDGVETTPTLPSLDRSVPATSPGLDAAARAQVIANIDTTVSLLKNGEGGFDEWLALGIYRDVLGDYTGAEEVWIYMTLRYTDDWRAFTNLGDLYSSHLLNLDKAELYLKKAIALQAKVTELYRDLFEVLKRKGDMTGAEQALKDGIVSEPKAIDLYILLARHYKESGNTSEAKSYYEQAIALANTEGNVNLVETLEVEKGQL